MSAEGDAESHGERGGFVWRKRNPFAEEGA